MVEISCNIDNLQSSVDFYLNITSKDEVLDSRFMRDRFFDIFEKEDSYREENFLVYHEIIKDDYTINTSVEPVLCEGEQVFDESCSYFTKDTISTDKENLVKDIEKDYPDDSEVFSILKGNNSENEKNSLVSERFSDYIESNKSENENTFDDEFVIPSYSGTENEDLEDEFVNWGSTEDSADIEEDDFGSWGSQEDYGDSEEAVDEDLFSAWGEDSLNEDVRPSYSQGNSKDSNEDDLGFFEDCFDTNFIKDNSVADVKNVVIDSPIKQVKEVTSVPNDLRDFIKMYPNCELSFVYKYFSKKEVEKQLRLGRVFKRKNKLMI